MSVRQDEELAVVRLSLGLGRLTLRIFSRRWFSREKSLATRFRDLRQNKSGLRGGKTILVRSADMVKECSFAGSGSGVSARTGNIPFSGCITSVQPKEDVPVVIHATGEHRTAERIVRVPYRDPGTEMLHRTFVGQYRTLCGRDCRPGDMLRVPVSCWRCWPATWCEKCSDYSQE